LPGRRSAVERRERPRYHDGRAKPAAAAATVGITGRRLARVATWVIPGVLARGPRPGYRAGSEFPVSLEQVQTWMAETRAYGVASIICLLDRDQRHLYDDVLPQGLVACYRENGFEVTHIPTPDGLKEPFSSEQYIQAWEAFRALPRAVLVHCSAGLDRTGFIVRYIMRELRQRGEI
jgi:hypothetical protein